MVFVNVPLPWQQNLAILTKLPYAGLMKFTSDKIVQILYSIQDLDNFARCVCHTFIG